jgi:hypothetical protein
MNNVYIAVIISTCFKRNMSQEKIDIEQQNLNPLVTPKVIEKKLSGRVDINHLIARVRKQKSAENKTAMLFFGLFAALFSTIIIILMF